MIYGFSSSSDTHHAVRLAQAVGVHLVRGPEMNGTWTAAMLENEVLYAAQRQIKLLLLYNSGSPTMPVGNLLSQIQRCGPAGTLWNSGQPGAGLGQWAPTHIEVGNEWTRRGPQFSSAAALANSLRSFYDLVGPTLGANAMKFIVEAEDATSGTDDFLNGLLSTQPTIRSMVDGWVVHNYGPTANEPNRGGSPGTTFNSLPAMVNRLNARGYTTDKIWITENGISTDNGAPLNNNYGWSVNKTYAQAGADMLTYVRLHGNGLPYSNRIYCWLHYQPHDWQGSGGGQREFYFGVYKSNDQSKGALTSAAIQLAAEFPYGGAPPPPPPDPEDPPASGFIISGQTMQWAPVAGATSYTTFESDLIAGARYKTHGTGATSFGPNTTPALVARPPGTSINVGWSWVNALGDHWAEEQVMTWPATTTALAGQAVMTLSGEGTVVESAPQSAEITDVVYRMVSTPRLYSTPTPFQISTGRELLWDATVSKFFYKP